MIKASIIMIGGRGVIDEEKAGICDCVRGKSRGRVTSHIFVKTPEGSSEKI